jgi:anaerobic ribonucleoside-triphosphate reductase
MQTMEAKIAKARAIEEKKQDLEKAQREYKRHLEKVKEELRHSIERREKEKAIRQSDLRDKALMMRGLMKSDVETDV